MPAWKAYRRQPQTCKDEWDQMWRALRKHEDGHREIFEKGLARLVSQLENAGKTSGAGLEQLIRNAEADSQREQNTYDNETDHGRSRGVEVSVVEACSKKSAQGG